MPIRNTEIALGGIDGEARVLHQERIIQAKLFAQFGALFGGGVLPHHAGDGVANIAEHGERDQGDRQHDEQRLKQASCNKGKHVLVPWVGILSRHKRPPTINDCGRAARHHGITT